MDFGTLGRPGTPQRPTEKPSRDSYRGTRAPAETWQEALPSLTSMSRLSMIGDRQSQALEHDEDPRHTSLLRNTNKRKCNRQLDARAEPV